ncbi:MAG: FISUMP domain-containing protein [Dysgonomonas sp.]|nr:FISUMP domain-containing protein [Dysgonomonas sp.]
MNVKGGIGMPRVQLTDKYQLFPMFSSESGGKYKDANGKEYTKKEEDVRHMGLWVYSQCTATFPNYDGLYVWDGQEWIYQGGKVLSAEVKEFTDPRDDEVYLYRRFGDAGEWMLQNLRYDPTQPGHDKNGEYQDYNHSGVMSSSLFLDQADGSKNFIYAGGPVLGNYTYNPSDYPNADWLANKKQYGLLYNFAAALNDGTDYTIPANQILIDEAEGGDQQQDPTDKRKGICPDGWYVPSDREWNDLEYEIHTKAYLYSYYTEAEVQNEFVTWSNGWRTALGHNRPLYPEDENGVNTTHPGRGLAMLADCAAVSTCGGKSLSAEQGGFDMLYPGVIYVNDNQVSNFGYATYFFTASRHNYLSIDTSSMFASRFYSRASFCSNKATFSKGEAATQSGFYSVRCKKNEP